LGISDSSGEKTFFALWEIFYFPPIFRDPGGEIFISPPYFETQGGKLKFSPSYGGEKARRRRKILGILTPEMLEILKENTFPNVKGAQKT